MAHSRIARVSALCGSFALGTASLLVWAGGASSSASAQVATKVDFGRDVQPLLKERCYECHGPTKQMNGYRLDQRSRALAGVIRPNIIPGSSDSSRLVPPRDQCRVRHADAAGRRALPPTRSPFSSGG